MSVLVGQLKKNIHPVYRAEVTRFDDIQLTYAFFCYIIFVFNLQRSQHYHIEPIKPEADTAILGNHDRFLGDVKEIDYDKAPPFQPHEGALTALLVSARVSLHACPDQDMLSCGDPEETGRGG